MSKKQHQLSRLKSLFNNLEEQTQPVETTPAVVHEVLPPNDPTGWTWELDAEGNYLTCSPEMMAGLGLDPGDAIGRPMRSYRIHPQSIAPLADAFSSDVFPCEITVNMQHNRGHWILVRHSILYAPEHNGASTYRGFAQILPADERPLPREIEIAPPNPPFSSAAHQSATPKPETSQPTPPSVVPSTVQWTLPTKPLADPAGLTFSFQGGKMGNMLLEVVDEQRERAWSEEDRQIVSEVANQLSLALENAQLFIAAQQELAERNRAEQIILHRNQDLAILSTIGQRLSSLESRNEIFSTLTELVGQVLDNRNMYICLYERSKDLVSFPVFREDGQPLATPDRAPSSELADYLCNSQKALVLTEQIPQRFQELNIILPERAPMSLIGVPFKIGEHISGALIVQDFSHNNALQFDDVHLELLSTAVSQAATALENARLFEQMQEALNAIEKRERYQGGVAQAAASLSELGMQALPDVLKYLGHAAQVSRVYLSEFRSSESAAHWKLVDDWTSPMVSFLFDRSKIQTIPFEILSQHVNTIHTNGWIEIRDDQSGDPASEFLLSQKITSSLILQVTSNNPTPNLLLFDQMDTRRRWSKDEINILQVAADAISNTYVREDLLNQLQINLEETEGLYKASNRLVAANDYQEMLSAVISGLKTTSQNRGILLLFEIDNFGKITDISVHGNWYSGYGTPPPPVGTKYPREIYEKLLLNNTQLFIEDVQISSMDETLRQALLQQNVRSLAALPMWSGKRQIGVLLIEGEQRHSFSGREARTLPPLVDQLTISVQNMHLFEQTQTALAETALLYNISSATAQAQNVDQMTEQVFINVLPRGADGAAVILFHQDEQQEITELEFAGYRSLSSQNNLKGRHLNMDDLPIVRMMNDEGLVLPDAQTGELDSVSRRTLHSLGVAALACVPLRSGGRLIGALAAMSQTVTQYDPADVRLLRTVANGIAVALEKQRLLREAQRRALELQTASEIARDTTSTLSLDLLLSRIVNLLSQRFNYLHTAIYFIDESGHYAILRESTGEVGAELLRRGHKLMVGSRSVVGMTTGSGEAIILNDVSRSPIYLAHPLLSETRSEMALPLRIGKRVIGALDIQSQMENAFSQEDVNILGILTDQISIAIENARAYELSQKAVQDMREVDRVKSQFLANMSHELRTPLNSIIGFSRVILKGIDGPINDTQKQDLSAIYSSGQHLLMLINDILDLSKIEAGKMELTFSDIHLADMINSAMSTAMGLVKDKPIKLVANVPQDLPTVRADSIRLRQVLINFLSNAAKFTEEGSITVEAAQTRSPENKPEILVTVTDTGPGIADVDQAKLFLPFSQVDDSPTRKTGGSGLGLSICRSLIELHGGRIGLLSSQIGVGSTFFFSLPLPFNSLAEETQSSSQAPENWTILSVEDDPQVIKLYQRYLSPQGYTVVAHTNPHTVVQTVNDLRPKAILLDVMMPGRDGWQVLQDLKTNATTRDIPIIICSIQEQAEKGFSLGAADYLVKPFLQDDLLNALHRLVQRGKNKRVLVIDDDPADLRLVGKMLNEDPGLQVQLAEGGKNGLQIAQRDHPDVIILDLLMPDMDGFDVLTDLRAIETLKDIPVIILTGADLTPEQYQKLEEFGQKLLTKGFLREKELLTTIEDSLRRLRSTTKS